MADTGIFPETTALHTAIDGLYTTFANYPLKRVIVGCPHCVSRSDSDQIHVRALNELTADDVRRYTTKAMSTFGDVDDFKHFLPRLLELLARELEAEGFQEDLGFSEEILGGKLALAGYAGWPAEECEAVERYLAALWATLLARYPSYPTADTILCFIAQFTAIAPYLAQWRNTPTQPASAHLALVVYEASRSTFWPQPALQHFEQWLFETETADVLQLAVDAWRAGVYRGVYPTYVELTLRYLAES